jgi:hypothetical protein
MAVSTAERKKMKIDSKDFRVREGDKVNLEKWPTKVDPAYKSKDEYESLLKEHVGQLSSQQQLLYASNRYAVLLIFRGPEPVCSKPPGQASLNPAVLCPQDEAIDTPGVDRNAITRFFAALVEREDVGGRG